MLRRGDAVGGDEVVRQASRRVVAVRQGLGVDQGPVGQQLVAVDPDLSLVLRPSRIRLRE